MKQTPRTILDFAKAVLIKSSCLTLLSVMLLCWGCAKPEQVKDNQADGVTAHSDSADLTSALEFKLLDGGTFHPFTDGDTSALVLIFTSTDCPIANAYIPYLKSIETTFREKGVTFVYVHSSKDTTPQTARAHANEFSLTSLVALDSNLTIAKQLGAEITPSVFILQPGATAPIYQGAIDNLYADYGKKRKQASQHYLVNALRSLTNGTELQVTKTKPIGCFIDFSSR